MDDLQYTVKKGTHLFNIIVLNLVINGWPSIQKVFEHKGNIMEMGFKPCYKWMTFNTKMPRHLIEELNKWCFKPCYKWMTFNTRHDYDNGFVSIDLF